MFSFSGTVLRKPLLNSTMTDNSGIFAFDVDFDDEGKKSLLEVFIKYNSDETHYYYCIIGDKKEYAFAKREDGAWVDMKVGKTELAERIGKIIETNLSLDHRFNSHR
jgi:hypothetical protein